MSNEPPFEVRTLDHLVLRTANLRRMIDFYCGVLGCRVERETAADVGLVQLRAGAALIDLVTTEGALGRRGGPPPGTEGRNLEHFCLTIDPFDEQALRGHLADHGVEASETRPLYGAEGVGPSIYVADPDGNTVEIKGPATPGTRLS